MEQVYQYYVKEREECLKDLDEKLKRLKDTISANPYSVNIDVANIVYQNCYELAENHSKEGIIVDMEERLRILDEYISRISFSFSLSKEYKEFKKALEEANFQTRQFEYFNYLIIPDSEIEAKKSSELKRYEILYDELKKYEQLGLLEDNAATITFEDIYNERKPSIRQDNNVPFDPAYDTAYNYYCNTVNSGNKLSRRIHNEILEHFEDRINLLSNMSPDEFREYKISQLRLNDNELAEIKANIDEAKEAALEVEPDEGAPEFEEEQEINLEETATKEEQPEEHKQEEVQEEQPEENKEETVEEVQNFETTVITPQPNNFEEQEIPIEDMEYIESPEEQANKKAVNQALTERIAASGIQLPEHMNKSMLLFVERMCPFDPNDVTINPGRPERKNGGVGALNSSNGSFWAVTQDVPTLTEVEYFITQNSSNEYVVVLNFGNKMRAEFKYNEIRPEQGTKINVARYNYPKKEPKFGIDGIEYQGNILPNGEIVTRGVTTELPSLYDEYGAPRNSSKETTGEFECDSYEELIEKTNEALKLEKGKVLVKTMD